MNTLSPVISGVLAIMKRKHLCRSLIVVAAVVVFMLAGAVRAGAEEEQFPDKLMLRFGGYNIRSADTIVRLDAANAPIGTYIDFADTLGGNTRATVFRLDGLYRFNEHHGLGFSYYSINFTGSRVLSQDIEWGGETFPINTQVDSKLEFDVYKLNYQYSVYHNDKVELGASFGFHIMKSFVGINASSILQSQSESVTAPLPVLGLFADYNFTPRFSVFYNYQFFFINYQDKIKGGLQDFLIGLEYRVIRNLALGFAYNRFGLNLELKDENKTLNLDTNWNGGMLYATAYF